MVNKYAMYKGDELLIIGTVKEISEKMKIKENTIRYYSTPAYRKRLENKNGKFENQKIVIRID